MDGFVVKVIQFIEDEKIIKISILNNERIRCGVIALRGSLYKFEYPCGCALHQYNNLLNVMYGKHLKLSEIIFSFFRVIFYTTC